MLLRGFHGNHSYHCHMPVALHAGVQHPLHNAPNTKIGEKCEEMAKAPQATLSPLCSPILPRRSNSQAVNAAPSSTGHKSHQFPRDLPSQLNPQRASP